MKTTAYIIVTKRGAIRATTGKRGPPALDSGEIALRLNLDIPDKVFEVFIPTVELAVSEESVALKGPTPVLTIERGGG